MSEVDSWGVMMGPSWGLKLAVDSKCGIYRSRYLVDGDLGTEAGLYVPQAQLGQVHRVLGQVPGHRKRVAVLEAGEPQPHTQELEHGVAFVSKYL
jgi:kynureninase